MSWDVYVSGMVDVGNTTYNLSKMYHEALGVGLDELNGMKCADAMPILKKAVADMATRPSHYREFDSPNGWGTYSNALEFLQRLLEMCENNEGHIEVS